MGDQLVYGDGPYFVERLNSGELWLQGVLRGRLSGSAISGEINGRFDYSVNRSHWSCVGTDHQFRFDKLR